MTKGQGSDKGTGTASQEDRERDTEVGEGQMHKDIGTGTQGLE